MRHRRLHGPARRGADPHRRPQTPRVSRLRFGRDRPGRRRGRPLRRQAGGQARQPADGHRRPDPSRGDRPRAHPLGHPRAPQRPQCPSPPGLHRRDHGHPQRDHRELPRAARRPRGTRPRPDVRDRHRGDRPPGRGGLHGRPCRGRPGCAAPDRGCLRDRRDAPRRGRPAGRCPAGRAARRGARRRRELPRLGRGGDPRPHRPDHLPRGGRRRRPAAVGRGHHRQVRRGPRARDHDHRLDARGRREGRLRALHAQGDPRAAGGPRPVDRRPGDPRRAGSTSRRSRGCSTRCERSTGSSSSPAAAPTTRRSSARPRCRTGSASRSARPSGPSSATDRRRSTSAR